MSGASSEVRRAWMNDWGCKSPAGPTGGNRELKATARDTRAANGLAGSLPARECGMEAVGEPQHRTKVKPRKAGLTWVSVPCIATPDFQRWQDGSEDGGGGTWFILTPGDLPESAMSGRDRGNATPMLGEKSDHPIRAMKPGNAGGAKGVTV